MVTIPTGTRGTSAERTGGTWTGLPTGFTFLETDTGNQYYWNGSAWAAIGTGGSEPYTYFIYKSGSTYYAKNGITKGIDYSGTDASTVINNAISDSTYSAAGGLYQFSRDDFALTVPINIPTPSNSSQPYFLRGIYSSLRTKGSSFHPTSAFPTNRYMFEATQGTVGSGLAPSLYMDGLNGYSLLYTGNGGATEINVGFLKYETDLSTPGILNVRNVAGQYMWRGLHLNGFIWYGFVENASFWDSNVEFIGDVDFLIQRASHDPDLMKSVYMHNCFTKHTCGITPAGGSMNYGLWLEGGYNIIDHFEISGMKYNYAGIIINEKSFSNTINHLGFNDMNYPPSPDTRIGAIVFDNTAALNTNTECKNMSNYIFNAHIPNYPYAVTFLNGAHDNYVQLAGYYGATASINDAGAGAGNVIEVLPGHFLRTIAQSKILTTSGLVRIIDNRVGAYKAAVSVQSGNASTVAFNIAHGLYNTPITFRVQPASNDAAGNPVVTATSTNLVVTYPVAPPTGTNNLTFQWEAYIY